MRGRAWQPGNRYRAGRMTHHALSHAAQQYMREPSAEAAALAPVPFPLGVNAVLLITFVGTILFGVYPNPVINFILRPSLLGH